MQTITSSSIKDQTLSALPNKVFFKSSNLIPPQGPPLLSIELVKKGKITKNKRFFVFYADQILYYKNREANKAKGVAFYDFDLKLEWLYRNPKSDVFPNEPPYGLRLIRGGDIAELLLNEIDDYYNLAQLLKRKLNIINFHFYYKALKKIGKGNFATVYLVESKETGFYYAVKAFLKDTVYSQKKGRDSLKNEIQIMRTLSHINILELREVYETENSLYLVMEMLKGGNMVSLINSKKRFTDQEIRTFLYGILQAVNHMHENGVMHRDIKPENILLRNKEICESNICIADFGLSTFKNVEKFLFSRCGTPGFVAPEIFNYESWKKKYNEICDEFSVGVIFHLLLFGVSIFSGRSYNSVVKQNKLCSFNFNQDIYQTISNDSKDLLIHLLEIDPEKRITAKEALEHEYFTGKMRKSIMEDDSESSPQQNLQNFNSRKFEVKNLTELNETIYIPIDIPNCEKDSILDEVSSSHYFVTNRPCLNGNITTCERMNSFQSGAGNDDPYLKDHKILTNSTITRPSSIDKESPGLKKALLTNTNPKIVFYDQKKRAAHKISNLLEDKLCNSAEKHNALEIKYFTYEQENNLENKFKNIKGNYDKGKLSPHKGSNYLEYNSKN